MDVLCMDTSGADCAVLLSSDGRTLASARETLGRGHAERLAPMVQAVLAEAGRAPAGLDRIGVVTGPGSFAGLRVGVAFARGLALTLDIPAIGVTLFDLWAAAHADAPLLIAAHDAKRGEIAWRAYAGGAPASEMVRQSLAEAAAAIAPLAAARGAPLIAGSAAEMLAAEIPGAQAAPSEAADMALLARLTAAADPAGGPPAPLYIRPPDAKPPAPPRAVEAAT